MRFPSGDGGSGFTPCGTTVPHHFATRAKFQNFRLTFIDDSSISPKEGVELMRPANTFLAAAIDSESSEIWASSGGMLPTVLSVT